MTMPTPTWKTENDLCRCCHTEAEEDCSFLSISEPVYNLGSTEIFTEILKSCFDIDLLWVKGAETAMRICNTCVQRLRDANNFKKQVQQCEARFKEINYEHIKDVLPAAQIKLESCFDMEVKKEFPVSSDSESDNDGFDLNFDDNDDNKLLIGQNTPVKTECPEPKAKQKTSETPKRTASKSPKKTSKGAKTKKTEVGILLKEVLSKPRKRATFKVKPTDYEQDGDFYICKHCGEKFKMRYRLRYHLKFKHYHFKSFICPQCKEGFMSSVQLVTHKFLVHHIDDRSKCNACDAVFNSQKQLKRHYLTFHKLGKMIKCSKCDYETRCKMNMCRHMVKHKTVKDFKCSFCDKPFLRKGTLILHEKIHTNDRGKMCDVCGQAFVQKASLNYHMAKQHPEVKF